MVNKKWRFIHLYRASGGSRHLIHKVLKLDPHLTYLYKWSFVEWQKNFSLSEHQVNRIVQALKSRPLIKQIMSDSKCYNILTIFDSNYPVQLRFIPDPPLVLYTKGNLSLLEHCPSISVIGTRYPSTHARSVMHRLLTPLLKKKWLIVSGMALGIDGYAHEMSLHHGSSTIAVLGSGFHYIYPKQHQELFQEISRYHLVVTEYPPNTPPKKFHFPERNRIISGLSFATLVVEAKEKSGSLITVDQALEQGREVMAVPGSILQSTSNGCNRLIQDGAKLVQSDQDIKEEWLLSGANWRQIICKS
ncbi:DNA-processing protein DprA [Gracilibacillus sp. YIM 98692]|uniref:DNA-processing protein DprA n=1 Tax=Gracilibacillus sp. YIM 98692 TaxID=2663532 RepID=UPI0013D0BA8B|nr:DNA-processing protein DprA [Gracilibacillus sp. YIM 98692]